MTEDDSRVLDFGPWDPGQPCKTGNAGACSLPPRKRLLAGLKQNGWLPSWQTCIEEADLMDEIKLEVDLRGGDDDCAVGESGERDGVHSSAGASDSDVNDKPCKRQKCLSFLADCPKEPLPDNIPKANHQNRCKEKKEYVKAAQSDVMPSKGIKDVDDSGGGNDDMVTYEDIVNAAKASAARCAKTAAETKAIALDKAAAAAQAAAVAKAALDAIAIVTEDMSKPAEDYYFSCKTKGKKKGNIKEQSEVNLSIKGPCKNALSLDVGREGPGGGEDSNPSFADDAELARQLHRAMNSSPRIYRNLLLLKKCETSRISTEANSIKKCEKSTERRLRCKIPQSSDKCGQLYRKKGKINTTKKAPKARNRGRPGRADVKLKSVNAINETLNFLQGKGNSTSQSSDQALQNGTEKLESFHPHPVLQNDTVDQARQDCNGHFVNIEQTDDATGVHQSLIRDFALFTSKAKRDTLVKSEGKTLPCMKEKSESDNIQSITIDLQLAAPHNLQPLPDEKMSYNSFMDKSPTAESMLVKTVMFEEAEKSNSSDSMKTSSPFLHREIEARNDKSLIGLSNHACDESRSLSAYLPSTTMT